MQRLPRAYSAQPTPPDGRTHSYGSSGQKSPSTSAMPSGHAARTAGSASKRAARGVGNERDEEAEAEADGIGCGGAGDDVDDAERGARAGGHDAVSEGARTHDPGDGA